MSRLKKDKVVKLIDYLLQNINQLIHFGLHFYLNSPKLCKNIIINSPNNNDCLYYCWPYQ